MSIYQSSSQKQAAAPAAKSDTIHKDPVQLSAAHTPAGIMQLQRSIGNQAAAQLMRAGGSQRPVQKKENRTGMPDSLKSGLENLSGMDMSDVRVHYNSDKPSQLQAHAYAQGNDIHIGPGQEQHLPHEGWHVVQQRQGRVRPTMQAKGIDINDDRSLEREADVMGMRAMQSSSKPVQRQLSGDKGISSSSVRQNVTQRKTMGRLDNITVEDTKYANNNEATIVAHMAGEWNGNNAGAVAGGHLLSSMKTKWGNENFQSDRTVANVPADGIYFTGSNTLSSNITSTQHEFYLAKAGANGQKSGNKSSTFWPKGWSENDLKKTLQNSYTTTTANIFASKANTSYWYTWQTLGANTAFPINRYPKME